MVELAWTERQDASSEFLLLSLFKPLNQDTMTTHNVNKCRVGRLVQNIFNKLLLFRSYSKLKSC